VVGVDVAVIVEVGELRGVPGGPALLDDGFVGGSFAGGTPLLGRCRRAASVAVGLGGLGVRRPHPGGQLVDEVLVLAPSRHRILPVIVKNLSREYISSLPFLIPPPRTVPSTMTWIPVPEGETST
jgi:hypothetical protein